MIDSEKIEVLKSYFQNQSSVNLAFLFGSFAKGFETENSDFDIGVYFDDKLSLKEATEEEEKVWFEITKIVQRSIDLVRLNEAPATLISNVIKTGIPLVVKDKKLYWKLYLEKSSEAEDFVNFAQDFFKISKKAISLSPETKIELLKRIQFLDLQLKELEEFKKLTFEEYQSDNTKRRNVERWSENILNAIIDIAKIILASEEKRMPRSYEEALLSFAIFLGFSEDESRKFSRFANLRNILAHEYLDILYSRIKNFIQEFTGFYKRISDFLEGYLKK